MVTAKEIGSLVDRARAEAGLSQRALADSAEISQPTLSRIIAGDRLAKIPELISIAIATGHTLAQLSGVTTAAQRARGADSPRFSELRDALLRFIEMDDYLDQQGIATVIKAPNVLPSAAPDDPQSAAYSFRETCRLGFQPIGDLTVAVSQAMPIDVAVVEGGGVHHALTLTDPEAGGTSYIGVPASDDPLEQRTWLAHEIGHILYREAEQGDAAAERNPASDEELRALTFARHLLVPQEALRIFFAHRDDKITDEADLSAVVQHFLVPPRMAAEALEEGGLTAASSAHEWMRIAAGHLAVRYGWMDQYRALSERAMRPVAPQKLCARAVEGYREGVVTARALATLMYTTEDAIVNDLAGAEVFPAERGIAWGSSLTLPDVDVDLDDLHRRLGSGERPEGPADWSEAE